MTTILEISICMRYSEYYEVSAIQVFIYFKSKRYSNIFAVEPWGNESKPGVQFPV